MYITVIRYDKKHFEWAISLCALLYIYIRSPCRFFQYYQWREKIWSSCNNRKVTIKVTNVDNKIQTEKEIRKHGNVLFLCAESSVVHRLWQNKHVAKFAGKSIWYTFREHILEVVKQPKYRYLENLLASIEEIGYITFFNNNVLSSNEALPNSIFVFDDVTCDKQDQRVLYDESIREHRLLLSVSDMCKDTEASYTW